MNKIFKVVWSKTKECYVVVSEVAKNNSGKKKVLASVLAALAVVGAGAAGTPVQAATDYNKKVNISPTGTMAGGYSANNSVSDNSIVVGYGNDTSTGAQGNGHVAYGFGNTSTEDTSTALGGGNKATGPASTAVGSFNEATARAAIAMGNVSKATGERSVAIGSGAEATKSGTIAIGRKSQATEGQAVAIGEDTEASGPSSVAVGYKNQSTKSVAVGFGVNNKVYGEKSTAVGSSNTIAANANEATVIGRTNQVNRAGSFVGGFSNVTNGERNVAVGSENTTTGEDSIGIGTKVIAGTGKTIAIGSVASNDGTTLQTIARGNDTINAATGQVNNIFALAIGNGAQADGKAKSASGMIAIGQEVLADNNNTVAIGVKTKATGNNGLAVGSYTQALGVSSAAFGTQAIANGTGATAFGPGASAGTDTVGANGSVAVGRKAAVTAEGGVGIGWTASASEKNATAIGFSATASGVQSVAIGGGDAYDYPGTERGKHFTTASGKSSVAVGSYAKATEENAMAFGTDANANIAGGVALGSESKTTTAAGVQGYNPASDRTNKYSTQSGAVGTSTLAAVSIGDGSAKTRQLTGLAAGTADTDAVNVAQLKNINLKYAADTGNSDVLLKDGTLTVKGDNNLISTSVVAAGADKGAVQITAKVGGTINNTDGKAVKPTTNGIATTDNVADAINDSYWKATAGGNTDGTPAVGKVKPGTQVTYSAGDNLKVKQTINNTTGDQEYKYSLNPVLTGITSIANTATGPKMTFGGNSINITGGSLDMGNNKITNLATGTDDKDAVNVKQLKDTEIHITPGTYTPDSNKKVTLTYENGDNKTVAGKTAVIDLSGLATGGTASTEKVKKAANGANDTNIAEVNPKTGDTFGDAGATYEVSVSRNAVKDAAREAVTINNGGTKSGTTYTPNADNPITVTPKEDAANHNTTYEVTFDGNKAAKQIPLTYKATNNGTTTADQTVKLDKGLNFTGGDYTTASVGADGKVTFDVNLGTAPTVTDGKPGVPGQAGAAGKDGIATVKTVVDTINNSGWKANAKANGGNLDGSATATVVKPGNTVNYAAGKNITVKQELETDGAGALTGNQTYTYSLNKDIDLTSAGSLTVGDTTVNNGGITIKAPTPAAGTTPTTDVKLTNTGLDNGGNKIVNVAPGTDDTDAVNVKQLKDAKTVLADGKNTKKFGTGTAADPYKVNVEGDLTEITSITNKADASGNAGKITFSPNQTVTVSGDHNISLNGKTGDITGLTNTTIPTTAGSDFATKGRAATEEQLKIVNDKFNNKINLGADGNTETTKLALDNNGGIKFNIKGDGSGASGANQYISTTASGSDIKVDLTQAAKDKLNKTYDVTSTDSSVQVKSTTTNGVTTFDLKVAPAAGTTSTWDIKSSADTANGGATATGHETAAKTIANAKTVEMIAGKNLTVKQTSDTNGAKVEFALSDEIAVGKDGANGVDGKIGVNGKDGASVVINGKDGSIGLTGPRGATGAPGASATLNVKDGVPGVDGAPGTNLTRIVYTDKNNVEHEVATHDDGMKFAGDDGQANQATNANVIKKHLNNVVDIIGGANKTDLTTDNIGVNNDGNGKLLVQLSKNLNGINTIKNGGTTITLNDTPGGAANTPAVTIAGGDLSVGGNKITNVNDGKADTDAVNVKQLKAAKTEVKAGENVTVKHTTDGTDNHNIYTVSAVTPAVYTKADGTKVYKIVDPTTGAVTWNTNPDGTGTVVNAGDVITSFETPANGTTKGSTTGGTMIVNNVGSAIKNQTGGDFLAKLDAAANTTTGTPNAAVNVSDLKNTADALKSNELHIRPTTSGRTGETVNQGATGTAESYKYDATTKSVTLKYNDGTGAGVTGTEAKIDLSDLANQITSGYTFKANATANGGTVANDATAPAVATTVENGGTINYAAGKNLTVKQDINATAKTHTYTYSLDKDLTNLDKVVVNGENGTNGKDGVTIIGPQGATGATGMPGTNGIDGKVGITGKDGKDAVSISGKDGIGTIGLTGPQGPAGADGRGVDITTDHGTQTLTKPEANNGGKSERIVYVPKDKDGNPLKDTDGNTIKREVATMDDGLKFAGDDGQANQATNPNVIKKQLNNVVDIIGGATKADLTTNNIGVNNDGNGKLLVQLSKNLNGINTIKNGGTTITLNDAPGGATNTPAVTISGGNLSMGDGTHNNKIVNVAPGTDDSDAVNYKQLKEAKTEVKAGENVTVKHTTDATDNHNIYTVSAVTPAVYTKADGTKVYKIVDPTTGAVTWNTSPDGTGTVVNAGDVITSFESPANGTTPGSTTGGNMIVNNVGSAIKNLGSTGDNYLTKLDLANNATPNAAVNVSDLKNTADALKANERHIAPTTVATGSTETKGGTTNAAGTANVYKYDAASKTVTLTYNDGNGNAVTDTKAVIDLSNLSTGGTGASSWNVKSSANTTDGGAVDANHNANAQNIADGKSVEFQSGKNLVVKQTNDTTNGNATVEFSLSDNITVGKDGANGKDGSVGAKGADGSAVVMNGKDGSIGLNGTNGANGISIKGKDGANGVGIDGKDGVTRIVYTEKVPDPANPGTTKEVTHEVATMDDGLKFTGNNTGTVNKHKLGSLVKVQGEGVSAADEAAFVSASGNIAVTAENNDTLTIRLNKNLKGLNSIQLGGNTIQSNGDNITFTTNGGTTKTVATTDQLWTIQANGTDVPATNGKVNVVGKDGITVAKNAAGNLEISGAGLGTMNGFDVTANNGATSKTIDNGKKVDFNAGSNLTVKQTNDATGTHIEYALKEAVDLGTNGSLKAGDTTVNKDGVTIANGPSITKTGVDAGDKKITNVADGAVNATSKDAVNGSQLKKYTDAAKTTVEAGDNNVKVDTDTTAADGHTNYKVSLKPVVTIGDTHKVKIDGQTGDITGLTNVDLTDPTFATKGRAATEEQLKQVLTEAKKKAVEKVQAGTAAAGDTNIATVAPKAGDTFGAAGATYEVSVSKNAVKDAAKEAVKVTSVSPAITVTPDTSVAHETTYKVGFDGAEAAKSIPLTYKANGSGGQTVTLDKGLDFKNGTNTTARIAPNGQVFYDVNPNLQNISSISGSTTGNGPRISFNNAGANSTVNIDGGNLNMNNNKITHVAPGTDGTDAVNLNQLKAARTKVTSNDGTVTVNHSENAATGEITYDLHVTPGQSPDLNRVNNRIDQLGEEIGRVGAQGAALSALKPIQYDPLEPTQIMAGYGNYRGNSAVALGVAHYKNESTLIHGGVSWAGGSSHMMANAGVTWKVGNRDSEAAVADRYRKGPISSAYAMQQEMAAMKAQNAGLKGEVSDLKAENEQMKAQIAAMMAKLGL